MLKFLQVLKVSINVIMRVVVILAVIFIVRKLNPASLTHLNIAIIEPSAGAFSVGSEENRLAYTIALDQINDDSNYFGVGHLRSFLVHDQLLSDASMENARQRLENHQVAAAFGCASSHCVRQMEETLEALDISLFYSQPYEGIYSTDRHRFMGPLPNQIPLPAAEWALNKYGRRAFILGSNTLYSRVLGEILRDHIEASGGVVTGEIYFGLDDHNIADLPDAWKQSESDVLLNVIVGDTNVSLMHRLSVYEENVERAPMLLLAMDTSKIQDVGVFAAAGHLVATPYNLYEDNSVNTAFKASWLAHRHNSSPPGSSEVLAFSALKMWNEAVSASIMTAPSSLSDLTQVFSGPSLTAVSENLEAVVYDSPLGELRFDPKTKTVPLRAHIAEISDDGTLNYVWSSDEAVYGEQYPSSRTPEAWVALVSALRDELGPSFRSNKTINIASAEVAQTVPVQSTEVRP